MLLKDKVAVVTGSSRGIGKAIARRFCREGAIVAGIYRSSDAEASELEKKLHELGGDVVFYRGSVCDRTFVYRTMHDVFRRFGAVDILINNAGRTSDQFLVQMTAHDWDDVFRTNYLGTYNCTLAALPHMQKKGSGKVVNVVSVSAILGKEGQTNYSASKGAIMGLTRLMARHYAKEGIYFNALAPGLIETEMSNGLSGAMVENILNITAMQRAGTATEVAGAVLFLASGLSDYCNGTVLRVDGGLLS